MKLIFSGNHLCKVNNGGCSHLCLLTPNGYQCACPESLSLESKSKSCLTGARSHLTMVILKRRTSAIQYKKQEFVMCIPVVCSLPSRRTHELILLLLLLSLWWWSNVTDSLVSKPILFTVASRGTPSLTTISTTMLQSRVQSVSTTKSLPGSPLKSTLSPTLLPSVGPPATRNPITCRPGTCENGGTCAETTQTCTCPQYYIGYDCSTYVGNCCPRSCEASWLLHWWIASRNIRCNEQLFFQSEWGLSL